MTRSENVALGWTLFHSLWQGAIVAVVLLAALSVVRSSRIRYASACVAMLMVVAGFAVTLRVEWPAAIGAAVPTVRALPKTPDTDLGLSVLANFNVWDVLPWLAPFWMAGVVFFNLRSVAGWLAARRLRSRGVCCASEPWQKKIGELGNKLGVSKPVILLETCLGEVPVVIGHLRPVILVPIGMLTGMPVAGIEAILLHELAHIRRRDYLVNILQTIVESFLFYHPAIWWISGAIRAERENCCDDLVVATSGRAREYATALATLEQNRWVQNQAALAANGGSLVKRIRRLLYPLETPRAVLTPVLSAGIC